MMQKPKIVVVGSFFMDLVFKVNRRPNKGETLIGDEFGMFTGGKGYNQAIAAARIGASVTMVGLLGKDPFGEAFLTSLDREKIDRQYVQIDDNAGTGVANPVIYESEHDNSIVIVPRANHKITPAHIEKAAHAIQDANLLMLQLEIEIQASLRAAQIARAAGVPVLLNPAPAQKIPDELIGLVDVLTPNEVEAGQLVGLKAGVEFNPASVSRSIAAMGPQKVVITQGEKGAYWYTPAGEGNVPPYKIKAVDPTAAGDAFCGAFAVAYAQDKSMPEAVRLGNAAGAMAATRLGAEPSLPTLNLLEEFLSSQG
ncbi:MAG: ribokinase [Veillonellaceae bacterium]|nr:ribokinase [Veillonellaceae bacterium]